MKKLIIDGHSHVTLPIERHIALMDEAGVDKAVLFRTNIHPELLEDEIGIKREMAKLMNMLSGDPSIVQKYGNAANEELFGLIRRYPDRFYCFGMISLDMELTTMIGSICQQIEEHQILGLGEFTLPAGSVSRIRNVFEASNQTGNLPIWIHCFNPLTLKDIYEIEVLAQAYPSVPVIIGHSGGSNWLETIDIAKRNANIYVDVSASFSTMALKIIIKELPDKTFYGVDYPYGDMWIMRKMIERVCTDEDILSKVLGGNIVKLLKLPFSE